MRTGSFSSEPTNVEKRSLSNREYPFSSIRSSRFVSSKRQKSPRSAETRSTRSATAWSASRDTTSPKSTSRVARALASPHLFPNGHRHQLAEDSRAALLLR